MIKSKIVLCGQNAEELAEAIEPDNLPNMSLKDGRKLPMP